MAFRWIPQASFSQTSLERLQAHFPRPQNPPPIAWFMQGIEYYQLPETSPLEWDIFTLRFFLRDIGGGMVIFNLRFLEWESWFHYLLPYLVQRCHEDDLLNYTITYFMNLHPTSIPDIYPEFRFDILHTLGQCLMQPRFWQQDDLADWLLETEYQGQVSFRADYFYGTFMCSMMIFCLKHLRPEEIVTWIDSIAAIQGKQWHYQFLRWVYMATILLHEPEKITMPVDDALSKLDLSWWETSIRPIEIANENLKVFVAELSQHRFLKPAQLP